MANDLQKVQPGDLITAEYINNIIKSIQLLEGRVASLEAVGSGGDAVVVTSLYPAGPIRIGQDLQVRGRNFGLSVGSCAVYVDNKLVTAFKSGSNDELLIFDVPSVSSMPIGGRSATLTVSNATSSVQRTIYVLPAQPLQGKIELSWMDVSPATINASSIATFEFRMQSMANQDAIFVMSHAIDVAQNASIWLNSMEVLDNLQNPVAGPAISLGSGAVTTFFIRINPVPDVPLKTPFAIAVTATSGDVSGKSDIVYASIGDPMNLPDENVSMIFQSTTFSPSGSGSLEIGEIQDTIRFTDIGEMLIKFVAKFRDVGVYDVIKQLTGASGWGFDLHPEQSSTITIKPYMLDNPDHSHSEVLRFIITSVSGVADDIAEFKLKRHEQDKGRTIRFKLVMV